MGIPNAGPKALLSRRHTEWVNIWNANCDASNPRSKQQLLQDLSVWERSQGSLQSSAHTVMDKNFDGQGWSSAHGAEFQDLITQARQRQQPKLLSRNEGPASMPQSDDSSRTHDRSETLSATAETADVRYGRDGLPRQPALPERHYMQNP